MIRAYMFGLLILMVTRLLAIASDDDRVPGESSTEVHLISVYEADDGALPGAKRAGAHVRVDRPGQEVVLVLTAYESVRWQVEVSESTTLAGVILGGYEPQSVVDLPDSTPVVRAWSGEIERPLYYSYRRNGVTFRRLVRGVHRLTGRDVASFHGRYSAEPVQPFVVDSVDDDPWLAGDYPRPSGLDELPDEVSGLEFRAVHLVAGDGLSFGEFHVNGPEIRSLRPLPKGVTRLVLDTEQQTYFGLTREAVVQVDLDRQLATLVEMPQSLRGFSQPLDLTYDAERNRLVVLTGGDGGYLYAYHPDRETWSFIAARPSGVQAIAHSLADDLYYGVSTQHTEDGDVATLVQFNAAGAVTRRIPLPRPFYPGCLSGDRTRLVAAGDYLVLFADPGGYSESAFIKEACLYVIDPEDQRVWLTRKETIDGRIRGEVGESG